MFTWSHIFILAVFAPLLIQCQILDPGDMFGTHEKPNDPQVPSTTKECSVVSNIILRRIIKKLFHQLDILQPSEIDDEFSYESVLYYDDYLFLNNVLKGDSLNCADTHRLDGLMKNFLSRGRVTRTRDGTTLTNLVDWFRSIWFNISYNTANGYRIFDLLTLCVVACILWYSTRSLLVTISGLFFIASYLEYHNHKKENSELSAQRKIDLCSKPAIIARIASSMGYDYNGCQDIGYKDPSSTNMAITMIGFVFELLFEPLEVFLENLGKGLNKYLNNFDGFYNKFIGPLLLCVILTFIFVSIYYVVTRGIKFFTSNKKPVTRRGPHQAVSSGRSRCITNGSPAPKKIKSKPG